MKEQKLIAITKAAGMIGVHPNTLRTWADKGIVHAVKLPSGYRRFTLEEIERVRHEMETSEPDAKTAG